MLLSTLCTMTNEQIESHIAKHHDKPSARFFVIQFVEGEAVDLEVSPKAFVTFVKDHLESEITRELHTVFDNGVSQVCLTVTDSEGIIGSLIECEKYQESLKEHNEEIDHLFGVDSDDWGPYDNDESYDMWKEENESR